MIVVVVVVVLTVFIYFPPFHIKNPVALSCFEPVSIQISHDAIIFSLLVVVVIVVVVVFFVAAVCDDVLTQFHGGGLW